MNKYVFKEVLYDRWAVWYKDFNKKKGSKIGVYKIIDLYSGTREKKFAFRYLPREDQTQEQSDNLILSNATRNFYRKKIYMGIRGNSNSVEA